MTRGESLTGQYRVKNGGGRLFFCPFPLEDWGSDNVLVEAPFSRPLPAVPARSRSEDAQLGGRGKGAKSQNPLHFPQSKLGKSDQ